MNCFYFVDVCTQPVAFPNLPVDKATCYLTSCTEFYCCVEEPELGRGFLSVFAFDPCTSVLTTGIESVTIELSLEEYNWGKSDRP